MRKDAHTADRRTSDDRLMRAAVALAGSGLGQVWPNPSVGAIIVSDEGGVPIIRGCGVSSRPGGPHAEICALGQASEAAQGATCYVTLEPCAHQGRTGPCAAALARAGVARVVIGICDPNPRVAGRGVAALRKAGIAVSIGAARAECDSLHRGHILRMREARPQIMLKLALSADGAIGLRDGGAVPITAAAARRHMHLLRARHDAILVGIGTALSDNPLLTCRISGMAERNPVRVVLDPRARLPMDSQILASAAATPSWIFVGNDVALVATDLLRSYGAEIIRMPTDGSGRFDLRAVLKALAQRGITQLMVEGGSATASAFIDADLVDLFALYRGTKSIGDDAMGRDLVPPFARHDIGDLLDSARFRPLAGRRLDDDRFSLYARSSATVEKSLARS